MRRLVLIYVHTLCNWEFKVSFPEPYAKYYWGKKPKQKYTVCLYQMVRRLHKKQLNLSPLLNSFVLIFMLLTTNKFVYNIFRLGGFHTDSFYSQVQHLLKRNRRNSMFTCSTFFTFTAHTTKFGLLGKTFRTFPNTFFLSFYIYLDNRTSKQIIESALAFHQHIWTVVRY